MWKICVVKQRQRYFDIFPTVSILGTINPLPPWRKKKKKKSLFNIDLEKYFCLWFSVNIRQLLPQQPSQPYSMSDCQINCLYFWSTLKYTCYEKRTWNVRAKWLVRAHLLITLTAWVQDRASLFDHSCRSATATCRLLSSVTWVRTKDRRTFALVLYDGRGSKVVNYSPSKFQTPSLGEGDWFSKLGLKSL